jgi:heme-degrading monooxygenase HmoA
MLGKELGPAPIVFPDGVSPGRAIMPKAQQNDHTVTQITVVEPDSGKQQDALTLMTERARFMAKQPGFISIRLHRSLDGRRIVNVIHWQNRDQLAAAHRAPEFRKEWGQFDHMTDTIDPHLYEVCHVEEAKAA